MSFFFKLQYLYGKNISNFNKKMLLFDVATFSADNSIESVKEDTDVVWWYFAKSTLIYFLVDTLASRMDLIEKSIRFKSEEYGGHCWEEMKVGTFSCKKRWVSRNLWDGTESCRNVQWFLPNHLRAKGNKASFKIILR